MDRPDGRAVKVVPTEQGAALEPAAIAVQEELRCRTQLESDEVVALRTALAHTGRTAPRGLNLDHRSGVIDVEHLADR